MLVLKRRPGQAIVLDCADGRVIIRLRSDSNYRGQLQFSIEAPASVRILREALPAGQLTVRELGNSYHVATLDNDAGEIFAGSLEFVRVHSRAGRERGWSGEGPRLHARSRSRKGVT